MTDPRDMLATMLGATQAEEMDCDTFVEHIAAYAENRQIGELTPLFEHHRKICPECEEELAVLLRILAER